MKKQLIPIFILSIISLILSLITFGYSIWAMTAMDEIEKAISDNSDAILSLFALFGSLIIILFFVLMIIVFAVTALLGVFGIMCALKHGKFSVPCIVLGSICSVFSLPSFISSMASITNDLEPIYLLPCIYFIGYTVSAIIAFIYRKKAAQDIPEQLTENPQ